jgi:hypothetical protein
MCVKGIKAPELSFHFFSENALILNGLLLNNSLIETAKVTWLRKDRILARF